MNSSDAKRYLSFLGIVSHFFSVFRRATTKSHRAGSSAAVLVAVLAVAACGGGGSDSDGANGLSSANGGGGSANSGGLPEDGSTQNSASKSKYTIGQFNMAGGDQIQTGDLPGNEAPDALLRSIRISRPAFITLQEACQDWSEYMDAQLPDYTVVFHPVVLGDGQDAQCRHSPKSNFGNAIVYRDDFGIDTPPVSYSLGSPAGMEQREMLCVKSLARKIAICTVHLINVAEAARAREILALEYADYTKFVGGDLQNNPLSDVAGNFYHSDYGHGAVGEFKEVDSPCRNKIADQLTTLSFDPVSGLSPHVNVECRDGEATLGTTTREKVDFLFVSPSVIVRNAKATRATYSDHDSLWAWVTVNTTGTTRAPGPIDLTPPTTVVTAPPPSFGGWHDKKVTVNFAASDEPGGTGVREIQVTLTGAQTHVTTISGSSGSVTVKKKGITHVTYFAIDNAGNSEAPKSITLYIKTLPPFDNDNNDGDDD
jgi:endonuclease/exonuclease/phosphatase family metal-dependent hydrolase